MKVKCPNCGFDDEGNFCSRCGAPLPKPSIAKEEALVPKAPWTAKCPVCKSGHLEEVTHKSLFGLKTTENLKCSNCREVFSPDGSKKIPSNPENEEEVKATIPLMEFVAKFLLRHEDNSLLN